MKDSDSTAELVAQDQALNSILTSSLNVELVYVILKSITSFSATDTLGLGRAPNHTDGLVVTTEADQDPITEIDMDASQVHFEFQTTAECRKKRTQILQQIEIKMVDNFADKKISDFMTQTDQGMELSDHDPLAGAFGMNDDVTSNSTQQKSEGGRLRKMSQQVQSVLNEAKAALHLDTGEDINTMTINEEVQVIEWAPAVFHAIKKMDKITPEMIEHSLSTDANTKQLFKAKESAGKSGSFMFSTFDKRFLIKTMNTNEQKVCKKMLPRYLEHLKRNPKSLIAKIYGIYTVKMEDIQEVHILLMGNLFLKVNEKLSEFDLKGSTINREVHMPFTMKDCLKDLNLTAISKDDKFLRFQRDDMRNICQQILYDIAFMAEHNLMDYSLLLITEKNPDFRENDKSGSLSKSSTRYKSVKSIGNALSQENAPLKRQISGVPEVEEEQEYDEETDEEEQKGFDQAIEKKLSHVVDLKASIEEKARPVTTVTPKLINLKDFEKKSQRGDSTSIISQCTSSQSSKYLS